MAALSRDLFSNGKFETIAQSIHSGGTPRNGTQASIDQAVEVNKRFMLIKIGNLSRHDVSLDDDVS